MKINVSIRLEEFAEGEIFDTQLKALLQELANNCQIFSLTTLMKTKQASVFHLQRV